MSEQSSSVSMKVVVKSVAMRWPKVNQMSTTTLDEMLTNLNESVILLVWNIMIYSLLCVLAMV